MKAVTVQQDLFAPMAIHNETHYRAWERFHAEHPEVYEKLVEFARMCKRHGFKSYGIRGLWERLRWHVRIERGDDTYKLNDHYPPYYARLIMTQCPDLAGFFETRERG